MVTGFNAGTDPEVDDDGLLAQAAALAGSMVAVVRHSGRSGTHKEFDTLIAGLEEIALEYPENVYVQRLLNAETRRQITSFAQQYEEVPKQNQVNDFKMAALNRCAQAAEWLDANVSPESAAVVKTSILTVCRRVATESSEEGSMSFSAGDTENNIDVAEQSALDEIARALGAVYVTGTR